MKKVIGTAAVLAVLLATPSMAADLPYKEAPIYPLPPIVTDWSGIYVGGSLGGRWANSTWTTTEIGSPFGPPDPSTTPASFNGSSTFRPGGYVGYNWEWAPSSILGVEADVAWGHNNTTIAGIPGTFGIGGQGVGLGATAFDSTQVTLGWDGSLRARLGVLVAPTWLIYATSGLAWQEADLNAACNGSMVNPSWCIAVRNETFSTAMIGWTVGGGVETLLWNNWLLRAEYRYADYGNVSHTFFSGTNADEVAMQVAVKTNTALFGLAYKF